MTGTERKKYCLDIPINNMCLQNVSYNKLKPWNFSRGHFIQRQ